MKLLWVDNGESAVAAVEMSLTDYRLYLFGRDQTWRQFTAPVDHHRFKNPYGARLDEPTPADGEMSEWLNREVAALIDATGGRWVG
ncbi:hypothetical protein K1W54_04295 [Micromonospora sp. CPCC 205371]|nr:hypothetical protein [Micromonospora sp. CPCC 205371]